jgi:hypothetical protein
MATALMIVPPMYEVQLFGQGYIAAQVSARKVALMDGNGRLGPSVFYSKFDAVEQMSFAQLVQFVLNKIKGQ